MATQTEKLSYLLQILWKSPIFGDSYPESMSEQTSQEQFKEMYRSFAETIFPILQQGMPEASQDEINEIIHQIGPKSIAFCASISAGEIEDLEYLTKAAAAVAISYWADQSMDRGDDCMLAAVQHLNHKHVPGDVLDSETFLTRLEALRHIQRLSHQITSSTEDLPYVLQAIERNALENEASLCILSRKFIENPSESFWNNYAQDVAQTMIDCSGLMSAVSVIYAVYRRHQPEIPSLEEIYAHPALMRLVRETFNPAVRVFDDAGDSVTDTGHNIAWGVFNLNIINQTHPHLIRYFLDLSGIPENHAYNQQAIDLFALPLSERRLNLTLMYRDLVRERMANLPHSYWTRYRVFLALCKRTLEAGFVNIIGDAFISENAPLSELDREFLQLITQKKLLSL